MLRFFIKLGCMVLIFVSGYFFLIHKLSNQYIDPYYPKFTQKATSLVLGISRAGEDIDPSVMEEVLGNQENIKPIINFALFKYQSPYGEVYLEGIQKKLAASTSPGIFILSVNPGGFSAPKGMSESAIKAMDRKMMMGRISNFTKAPNYNYIMRCYEQPLYNAIFPYPFPNQISHANGWNEVLLETPSFKITTANMKNYKAFNKREYTRISEKEEISNFRIRSFQRIIRYLKTRGSVFIVQLPADIDMYDLEKSFWPELTERMKEISNEEKIPFIDNSNEWEQYNYYDGSHMISESAQRFSKTLSLDIKKYLEHTNVTKTP